MKITLKLVTRHAVLSLTAVFAADWPWLYGPRRDHTSEQKGLLRTWPQEGPKVLWTVPWAPASADPPSAAGTCICWTGTRRSATRCACSTSRAAKSCGRLPTTRAGSFMFAGSRTTPTVDGEHVYTVGPMGDLHAISTKTRKPAWRKNIWKDFGGDAELPRWAIVQNPLIYGDLLIVATADPGGRGRRLRQADRRRQMEVCRPVRHSGIRDAVDRQGRRRGSPRHDHRRRRSRPHRQGRQRQRSRPAQRQGAVDLHRLAVHHPRPAARRRRRRAACSSPARMAPAR